jgi:hypothetical protein
MKLSPEDFAWYQAYRKKVLGLVEDQRGFMAVVKKKNFTKKKKPSNIKK